MKSPRAHLAYLTYLARRSLWLLPATIIVSALLLAMCTLYLDHQMPSGLEEAPGWLSPAGAEGSRAVLSVIASSMITVASLVFSMTLVAFSLASSQLGPRLLTTLMGDRRNQFSLGAFLGTFVYSLVVLRTIGGPGDSNIPHLSVSMALLGALASFALLIYFFHHVAESMQADTVIARVSEALRSALENQTGERDEQAHDAPPSGQANDWPDFEGIEISCPGTGYVQAVDHSALLRLAVEHDVHLDMAHRAGHFVIEGTPLASVFPPEALENDDLESGVRGALVLGPSRTPVQDIEFSIRQLTEIALRALSPGINDPHTASACVDQLGGALALVLGRSLPEPLLRDDTGRPRVRLSPVCLAGLLDTAFDEIRQAARSNIAVSARMLDRIADLARVCRDPSGLETLQEQAERIRDGALQSRSEGHDREAIEGRFRTVEDLTGRGR